MRTFAFLATCALLVGGCRLEDTTYSDPGYSSPSRGELTIDNAHQTGAMGEIATFDGNGDRLEAYRDGSGTFVQIDSIGRGWWVMSAISFDQDVDTLVPGTLYTSGGGAAGSHPISVEVRGCSGPEYTDYTYDDLAQRTAVQVEELTGGERRVHYDCTFTSDTGETQHTVGYFDYAPSGSATGAAGVAVVSP